MTAWTETSMHAFPFRGGLLDFCHGVPMRRRFAFRNDLEACRADRLEVGLHVSNEDRLADDRPEAATLGFEDTEDGAIDRLGLLAGFHCFNGRLTQEEDLRSLGPFDPTKDDRAAGRLDRLCH